MLGQNQHKLIPGSFSLSGLSSTNLHKYWPFLARLLVYSQPALVPNYVFAILVRMPCVCLLSQGALGISTLDQAGAECKVDGPALMLHENHKVSSPL
jgi:hypothetical protein